MPTSRVRTSRHCEDREREVTKAILLRVNSTNSSDTERRGVKWQALLGCDICHDVMVSALEPSLPMGPEVSLSLPLSPDLSFAPAPILSGSRARLQNSPTALECPYKK